jgi:D-glycero-D-manno-heptose 1,7-bisphosphate phosphatase
MSGRRALFLDRDGTLVQERDYLADPERVEFVPGAVDALRAFRAAGYALVIVTNQSGIARGLYTAEQFHAVQERVELELDRAGVRIDAVFHCPHHPDFTGPCDCRKPELGMYRAAAQQLGLDLGASLYVGDRVKDVQPALRLGGRGCLVQTGYGAAEAATLPDGVETAADLASFAWREGVLRS